MFFVVALVWFVFAIIVSLIASGRGHSGILFFLVSCFLSPLVGLLLALVIPSKSPVAQLPAATAPSSNDLRWQTLTEVDEEIQEAALAARAKGADAEKKLAEKYLAVNDKQYLQGILENVLNETDQQNTVISELDNLNGGRHRYKINDDGSVVITKGNYLGRKFQNTEDFRHFLEN